MLVVLLLICWPVAEVYAAIQIAEAIGVLWMLLLLVASWPLGTWALRSQGRAAWLRLADAVAAGRPPGREVLDGALVLVGGLLMIVPGFITDLLGACLLLPPTRALARGLALRNLSRRFVLRTARFAQSSPSRSYDVESTATDIDQPRLRP